MTFEDLGLGPEVLKAVEEAGYTTPTPIQEQAIPIVLMGRDVLGCAQTGTGKTAGFTLPMIEILAAGRARARMPRSLILTPTRELATQIAENFKTYGKYHKLSMALLIGGVSFDEQNSKLDRGVDVLIATPGRLLDHFGRGGILLTDIKILVIDEADRMMDMGFIPDVERIVGLMPKIRQTLFFSATMPPEIRRIADSFLMNPKEISISPDVSAAETVEHFITVVDGRDAVKGEALRTLILREDILNAIIFCNRKKDVDTLERSLRKHKFSTATLHGDMSQPARLETLANFRAGGIQLLVASDVAARGLDLPKVSHVFNFDVPIHAEDYVHRIGRTGRAGRSGRAFTLATPDDGKYIAAIEQFIGGAINRFEIAGVEEATLDESGARGGRGRRTPGSPAPVKSSAPVKSPARKRRPRKPAPTESVSPEQSTPVDMPAPVTAPTSVEMVTPVENTPEQPRPVEVVAPVQKQPEQPRPARSQSTARPKRNENKPREKEGSVVGMGDHMPAFMLRSLGKK
jgi:superfamily II DNA/RNA helicase